MAEKQKSIEPTVIERGAAKGERQPTSWLVWLAATFGAVLVGAIMLAALGGEGRPVSALPSPTTNSTLVATSLGAEWPWPSNPSAELRCHYEHSNGTRRPAVTVYLDGIEYGVNAPAIDAGYMDSRTKMRLSEWGTYDLGAIDQVIRRGIMLCLQ